MRRMRKPRLAAVAAFAGAVVASAVVAVSPAKSESRAVWAQVATHACERMDYRMSSYGPAYWKPLIRVDRMGRVTARLRRTWLIIHEEGLRWIRSRIVAPTRGQTDALGRYKHMLSTIRGVIREATAGDKQRFLKANIRMVRSIVDTRRAFFREGAGNICGFAI